MYVTSTERPAWLSFALTVAHPQPALLPVARPAPIPYAGASVSSSPYSPRWCAPCAAAASASNSPLLAACPSPTPSDGGLRCCSPPTAHKAETRPRPPCSSRGACSRADRCSKANSGVFTKLGKPCVNARVELRAASSSVQEGKVGPRARTAGASTSRCKQASRKNTRKKMHAPQP
ncbi:hypothetical protein B0H13DRAFT_856016 [Mycena leptocephala]|nr:hypothetical protein B0H13DRAFT_856016 [Mycena leptocephala]